MPLFLSAAVINRFRFSRVSIGPIIILPHQLNFNKISNRMQLSVLHLDSHLAGGNVMC